MDDDRAKRTQDCLAEMEARFRKTGPQSDVILIVGRIGAGKSSLLEDLAGVRGYAQQNADSVTQTIEVCSTTIRYKKFFIMDTPGFEPGSESEERVYREIVRGLRVILPFANIAGLLYVSCISQERFDNFDRKLVRFIRGFCGELYIPRVTFVTTFWTAAPGQEESYKRNLQALQVKWGEGLDVDSAKLQLQIAQSARSMLLRNYGDSTVIVPQVVRELQDCVPIHETDAGSLLGLLPPTSSATNKQSEEKQQDSSASSGSLANPRSSSGTASSNNEEDPSSIWTNLLETTLGVINWFTSNVKIDVDVGGRGGGRTGGPSFTMGNAYRGPGDPHSSVDVFKSLGLDSSMAGRTEYAEEHDIRGKPGTAEWNARIRDDARRRYG
ncbi:uncharacterized protein BDV14DRAFT_202008 [Aspergillus stella-maris]|uniref:uncharacterized protein n=1 Tax=Aspergillus stella-maris TaxID=1810926 RepID=UPI003CCD3E28